LAQRTVLCRADRHREETALFVATNTAEDLKVLAKQMARQDERRAASAFHQLDGTANERRGNPCAVCD